MACRTMMLFGGLELEVRRGDRVGFQKLGHLVEEKGFSSALVIWLEARAAGGGGVKDQGRPATVATTTSKTSARERP